MPGVAVGFGGNVSSQELMIQFRCRTLVRSLLYGMRRAHIGFDCELGSIIERKGKCIKYVQSTSRDVSMYHTHRLCWATRHEAGSAALGRLVMKPNEENMNSANQRRKRPKSTITAAEFWNVSVLKVMNIHRNRCMENGRGVCINVKVM